MKFSERTACGTRKLWLTIQSDPIVMWTLAMDWTGSVDDG